MNIFPDISWDFTDYGVRSFQDRRLPDSSLLHRVTEIVVSNIRVVADPRVDSFAKTDNAAWTLPIDDRRRASSPCSAWVPKATGVADDDQRCADLRREVVVRARRCGHQRHPGDFEAEVGQGVVTLHSEEHLAASDRGW
ncbi:MAG TPA: hypothetical protein VFV63_15440 [Ilumatobacteraceae bacterium]|nr:hypothetical protein [Ilumatobacteraceae bacterium]